MRILAVLAIVATLGWCGYWFVGARALEHGITTGLSRVSEVEVADHTIRGFPNRFDVTLTEPRYAANGLQWSSPFVQIFALSYRLNHLIAVFAHDQHLVGRGFDAFLHSEDLRASVVFEAGLDLPLDRMSLVGQQLELSLSGNTTRAEALRVGSQRQTDLEHAAVIRLENLFPDSASMDRIDPNRLWPRQFDALQLNAEVAFDRPLDRTLIGAPEPRLQRITFTGAELSWLETTIITNGRLTLGAQGLLSGDLSLSVTGWRALMQTARSAGMMPAEHDALIAMATQGLISADDPNRIDAAFSVVNGVVSMGPIVLGQLPALN